MELLENHIRTQWRYLNHGQEYSDLRCIDVNAGKLLDRSIVQGEEEVVKWARIWNEKGNCFIGRNPRHADGTVSRLTTYSYDLDPIRPKGTATDEGSLRSALRAGRLILQECSSGYLASSGNGALVLFRLAVPIRKDFKAFEQWLASREDHFQQVFSSGGLNVKCDRTHDSARIVKLLGTTSTKGDRALWRVTRFIDLPSPPYRVHPVHPGLFHPSAGDQADEIREPVVVSGIRERSGPATAVEKDGRGGTRTMPVGALGERIESVTRALARLNPKRREDYDSWLQVGMSLTELGTVGLQLWDAWSRPSTRYQEGICATKWKTFKTNPQGGSQVSIGSLIHWADSDSPNTGHSVGQSNASGDDDALSLESFMSDTTVTTWLCRPFIARETIGFVAGLPETMKTWLMMDLAVECAKGGGLWLGLFPVEGARVLFVDQERAKSETQRRFKSIMGAKGLVPAQLEGRLAIRTGSSLQVDNEASFRKFTESIEKHKPDIIIIDSFATIHSKEENSRSEIQTVMERIKYIRNKYHCTVVFVDHENKSVFTDQQLKETPSAFRMAGSVAKPAAAEFVLTVRRFDPHTAIIHHTKSTLAPSSESFSVSLMDVENGVVVRGQK